MKISVIMPVYNENLSELNASINSILNQTYKDFELIIVDDNPRFKALKKFLLKRSTSCTKIKVFFNKRNMGTIYSADKAINKSNGTFIARMDADDISNKNRLKIQLSLCNKWSLDFLCSNFKNIVNGHVVNENVYSNVSRINQDKIKKVMSYINIATGSTLFFRRSVVNKIGKYRNFLDEDYDLALRFLIFGYRMGYVATPLIYKRCRNNNLSSKHSLKEFIILKSLSKYVRKYKFKYVMPLSEVRKSFSNINNWDIKCYRLFKLCINKYKSKHSFIYLLGKYFWTFSSILVFKRNLFVKFGKNIQDYLLK